jgi:hypothetical protein
MRPTIDNASQVYQSLDIPTDGSDSLCYAVSCQGLSNRQPRVSIFQIRPDRQSDGLVATVDAGYDIQESLVELMNSRDKGTVLLGSRPKRKFIFHQSRRRHCVEVSPSRSQRPFVVGTRWKPSLQFLDIGLLLGLSGAREIRPPQSRSPR